MKTCTKCKETKSLKHFGKQSSVSSGYTAQCKQCRSKHQREWYQDPNNREKERTRTHGRIHRLFKKTFCEECGFIPIHTCQLDVDHIDGNHDNNNAENLKTLCANCHRLKTHLHKNDRWNKSTS